MKIKLLLILIIPLLMVGILQNYSIVSAGTIYPTIYSIVIKDESGNLINYGTYHAYIDGIECDTVMMGEREISINHKEEDFGKEITFAFEIEEVFVDIISNINVYADDTNHIGIIPDIIILTASNLPPLIENIEIYYEEELVPDNNISIDAGYPDNVVFKVYGVYSDNHKKDITNDCIYFNISSAIKYINPGEFKFLKWESNNIRISYVGIEKKLYFNIVDLPPNLLTSSIQDNEINISISNTNIFTFTFDKLISQGVDYGSISILNSQGSPIGVTKLVYNNTLSIKPIVNLAYESNYILYIPANSIKNLGTQSNTEDLLYHFTTIAEVTTPTALLKTISIGDTSVAVIPNVKTYNITLPKGTTVSPIITVAKNDKSATINIPSIEVIPGSVEITVRSADGTKVETYVINLTVSEVDSCFIATATYGSLLEPHVVVLRQFRDNVLMKFDVGKWFVKNYYTYSPPIANYIRGNEGLKFVVRMILTPLIFVIQYWWLVLLGIMIFICYKVCYKMLGYNSIKDLR